MIVSRRFRGSFILAALSATGLILVACSGNDLDFRADPAASGGSGGMFGGSGGKAASSGGSSSKGGSGGSSGSMSSGGGDDGGEGGSSSSGGSDAGGEGGADVGGSGGSDVGGSSNGGSNAGGEGGADVGGSGGACNPVDWFPDDDGDDFGRTSGKVTACVAPGNDFARVGGDCNDDNGGVNPGQVDFTDESYSAPGGGDSFDWDCSGFEQSDPSQLGLAPTCPAVLLGCEGSGYVPTQRSGPGVNVLCGSHTIRTCVSNGIGCTAQLAQIEQGHRCR